MPKLLKLPYRILCFFSIKNLIKVFKSLLNILSFVVLLLAYLLMSSMAALTTTKYFPKAFGRMIIKPIMLMYNWIVKLNTTQKDSIHRVDLIELAIRNMRFKKSRTFITIGGMSIGIAAIIFLVSLGYGLQSVVTSRVARLDEMKQSDISTQPGSNMKITDETLSKLKDIEGTKHTLPLIALVGRVNYNESVIDMAVYGVTSEYLRQSAIKPVKGDIFASDNMSLSMAEDEDLGGSVAGDETKVVQTKEVAGAVEFTVTPTQYVRVRSGPSSTDKLLGYTTTSNGLANGTQVWGEAYYETPHGTAGLDEDQNKMGKWILSDFEMYDKVGNEYKPKLSTNQTQVKEKGYIAMLSTVNVVSFNPSTAQVLGESTAPILVSENRPSVLAEATTAGTTSATTPTTTAPTPVASPAAAANDALAGITEINGEFVFQDEADATKTKVTTVPFDSRAVKEAVINRAMLKVLNINEEEAIGKTFDVAFIVTNSLLDNPTNGNVQSESATYKIVGLIPQDDTPFFYAPFIDLRGLGITNYSQIKLVADDQEVLTDVRKKAEAMGYLTSSVVDTVDQINRLFGTARTVLALIGTVALAVAALGMFNTLTVSLLERIREIGLMKAMGMKSHEVKELFLTESMIMGFFGGILGIFMGYVAGKLVSVILTAVAINTDAGFINVSQVPPQIILVVMTLSITVGLITGIYPAKRATSISALNALRYE